MIAYFFTSLIITIPKYQMLQIFFTILCLFTYVNLYFNTIKNYELACYDEEQIFIIMSLHSSSKQTKAILK